MECHICKQCLQNCVEPCLGDNWEESKEYQRNPSSCIPCKSGRLIKCSICRTDLDMSNQEIQKLPFEDMMKYLQIAYSKQKQKSVSQSSYKSPKISPTNSSSNSPKYSPINSPIMGARKFLMNCFSPNNSPKNTRTPLQTIREYERHDLVLYNVNNKYTCTV